jgi:DNA-binding MarR family transcriptional regulator
MAGVSFKSEKSGIEPLFHEVTLLANQIKKAAFKFQDEEVFLAVGRNLMESLSEKGPQTVPALAELRSSSRQNVQIMVNRLMRLGCVEVRTNPEHKKSGLVCLTDTGRTALEKAMDGEKQLFAKVSSRCSGKEIQRGLDLISKLRKALENEEHATSTETRPRAGRGLAASKMPPPEKAPAPDLPRNSIAEEPEVEENSLPYNLL